MREYWDARAREDPFYFVDNRLRYRHPDRERFWAGGPEGLDEMLDALRMTISPADAIVEIGCGIGRMTRPLAARGRDVRAVDVSERMLEIARREHAGLANVDWLLGDGHTLAGIASSSADVVHSDVVFQHLPNPLITLGYVREIGRVLRPGGWAAIRISNDPAPHRRRPSLRERIRRALLALAGRGPRGQGGRAWIGSAVELDQLATVAAEAGMAIERTAGAGTIDCLVLLRRREP